MLLLIVGGGGGDGSGADATRELQWAVWTILSRVLTVVDPIDPAGHKLLIPFILLFGLYVQFHGAFGPGGGFQAGVILAAAVIFYGLIFGLADARELVPEPVVESMMAIGVAM